jgi:hypothetical protein
MAVIREGRSYLFWIPAFLIFDYCSKKALLNMKKITSYIILIIFTLLIIFLFGRKDISDAILRHKENKVRKLSEKYFRIKYPPPWETVEYEVMPFIDNIHHDKKYYRKNDVYLIKLTYRNSETYDSLVKTHPSADIFMDWFNEAQKLNKYLHFKVTNGIIIEPVTDSIVFNENEIRRYQIFNKIIKKNK